MVDGVEAYKAYQDLASKFLKKPIEEFKIAFDLLFDSSEATPNFGTLAMNMHFDVLEKAGLKCISSVVEPKQYAAIYQKAMQDVEVSYSMMSYAILHSRLFDKYICDYFYGDLEILMFECSSGPCAAVKSSELSKIKKLVDFAVECKKLAVAKI